MSLPKNHMLTGNGILLDLLNPKEEQICLEDISLSLSKLCRYTGGCHQFYSVAQHSLNCYKIARELYDEKTGLYLLLHDASETYISDIPTPVKKLIVNIEEIEKGLATVIYRKFSLDYPVGIYLDRIVEIDSGILANEIPQLVPKLESIIPKGRYPYDLDLDFEERNHLEVRKEFEETVLSLIKK